MVCLVPLELHVEVELHVEEPVCSVMGLGFPGGQGDLLLLANMAETYIVTCTRCLGAIQADY